MRADGHVPEKTETHRASAHRVVTWRANRAKASPRPTPVGKREVDAVEHRTRGRGRGIPGSFAHNGVRVEPAAARLSQLAHRFHVRAIVRDRQLVDRRVARFYVGDASEELGIVA
jgi:anti-sigma factor RsiW